MNIGKGANYFYCGGRLFFGAQSFRPLLLSSLLITAPNAIFLSYNFYVSNK